jgi:hypothetical protein
MHRRRFYLRREAAMDSTVEGRVRTRAYDKWLRDRVIRGHFDHHWFQAVRDTLAALDATAAGAPAAPPKRKRSKSTPPAADEKPTRQRSAGTRIIAG